MSTIVASTFLLIFFFDMPPIISFSDAHLVPCGHRARSAGGRARHSPEIVHVGAEAARMAGPARAARWPRLMLLRPSRSAAEARVEAACLAGPTRARGAVPARHVKAGQTRAEAGGRRAHRARAAGDLYPRRRGRGLRVAPLTTPTPGAGGMRRAAERSQAGGRTPTWQGRAHARASGQRPPGPRPPA